MSAPASRPIWHEIQKLIREIDLRPASAATLVDSSLKPLFNELRCKDLLQLSKVGELAVATARGHGSPKRSVGTATLLYGENTELTIFALPPGTKLPLHDHPKMHVLNKVLFGKLHEFSADWVESEKARCVAFGTADESSPVKYVTPESGGVLHEFWSSTTEGDEEGCVFIDFFSPRYGGPPNFPSCSYYALPELKSKSLQSAALTSSDCVGREFECVKIADPDISMHSLI